MKIGIIGGIGPESTVDYYRFLINAYQGKKNDGNYPEIIINSINMKKMLDLVGNKECKQLVDYLSESINAVYNAGAELVIIASNTPHIVFDEVQTLSPIPIISIVEATCKKAADLGFKKIGLFGTGFTMQTDYYQKVFERNGISIVVPNPKEQEFIHYKIFSELQSGTILEETKKELLSVVKRMAEEESIEGLILGCTELPLILKNDEYGITFLNTTKIHVDSVIDYIFDNSRSEYIKRQV